MMTLADQILPALVVSANSAVPDATILDFIEGEAGPSIDEILRGDRSKAFAEVQRIIPNVWRSLNLPSTASAISPEDLASISGAVSAVLKGSAGSYRDLLRALVVIRVLEQTVHYTFKILLPYISVDAPVLANCAASTRGLECSIKPMPNTPRHEIEAIDDYSASVLKRDYVGIVDFFDMLERGVGLPRHPVAMYLPALWAKSAPAEFAEWINSKVATDFLAIRVMLSPMPFDLLMSVALQNCDCLVKLEAVRLALKDTEYKAPAFCVNLLADALKTIVHDPEGWDSFCRFFGRFPLRYKSLWFPVGLAMNGISDKGIAVLLTHFDPGRYNPPANELGAILQGMVAPPAASASIKILMDQAVARWRTYLRRRRRDIDNAATDIELSSYYVLVLNAFIMRSNPLELRRKIRRLVKAIERSTNRWFEDSGAFRSHMVLAASLLFPYLEAHGHVKAALPDPKFEDEIRTQLVALFDFYCHGVWSEGAKFAKEACAVV